MSILIGARPWALGPGARLLVALVHRAVVAAAQRANLGPGPPGPGLLRREERSARARAKPCRCWCSTRSLQLPSQFGSQNPSPLTLTHAAYASDPAHPKATGTKKVLKAPLLTEESDLAVLHQGHASVLGFTLPTLEVVLQITIKPLVDQSQGHRTTQTDPGPANRPRTLPAPAKLISRGGMPPTPANHNHSIAQCLQPRTRDHLKETAPHETNKRPISPRSRSSCTTHPRSDSLERTGGESASEHDSHSHPPRAVSRQRLLHASTGNNGMPKTQKRSPVTPKLSTKQPCATFTMAAAEGLQILPFTELTERQFLRRTL